MVFDNPVHANRCLFDEDAFWFIRPAAIHPYPADAGNPFAFVPDPDIDDPASPDPETVIKAR